MHKDILHECLHFYNNVGNKIRILFIHTVPIFTAKVEIWLTDIHCFTNKHWTLLEEYHVLCEKGW
jgi:hypothetical protein